MNLIALGVYTHDTCPDCGGEAVRIAKTPRGPAWCAQGHQWIHGQVFKVTYPLIPREHHRRFGHWQARLNGAFGSVELESVTDREALSAVSSQVHMSHLVCVAALQLLNEHTHLATDVPEGVALAQALRAAGYGVEISK